MSFSNQRNPKVVFVLQKKDLSKLNEVLRDFLGAKAALSFRLECRDGTRQFEKIDQVNAFDNGRKDAITRIVVSGHSEDYRRTVRITFASGMLFHDVRFALEGPENTVKVASGRLEELVASVTPWYWRIAKADFMNLILVFSIFWLVAYCVLWSQGKLSRDIDWNGQFVGCIFAMAAGGILMGCNMLKEKVRWTPLSRPETIIS